MPRCSRSNLTQIVTQVGLGSFKHGHFQRYFPSFPINPVLSAENSPWTFVKSHFLGGESTRTFTTSGSTASAFNDKDNDDKPVIVRIERDIKIIQEIIPLNDANADAAIITSVIGLETLKIGSKEAYDPSKDSFFTQEPAYGSKDNKGLGDPERPFFVPPTIADDPEELTPPTDCCRSGCPNCVWIEYVEKLSLKYSNPELSREKVLADLDTMEDQSIKAFIKLELRSKGLI